MTEKLFVGKLDAKSAVAVIMAGGSGTRFWPLSRRDRPKQFLPLAGGSRTLIQATADRVRPLTGDGGIVVVTAGWQVPLVREQMPEASVLVEPDARNTAACIGFAALKIRRAAGDVPFLALPADHLIAPDEAIRRVFTRALEIARSEDVLVTIGIPPTEPETGYGYMESGDPIARLNGGSTSEPPPLRVRRFVEKPDRATAEAYVRSGRYFWNSGMFAWRPSTILAAIERSMPELGEALRRIDEIIEDKGAFPAVAEIYRNITPVSIDVGVMEMAANVVMLRGDGFRWSDVGSWHSWGETSEQDGRGNVVSGNGLTVDSDRSVVVNAATNKSLVVVLGAEDLVVVQTDDCVLVCPRSRSQDVKKIVEELQASGRAALV